ncbi:MAG TPA: VCBS repeat-containing protein, partial [Puia sp.]
FSMNTKSLILKVFAILSIIISLIIPGCANSSNKNSSGFNILTIKAGKGPGSVEVADFNKDGFPDIALASTEDSSVIILLGNGKGEFTESSGSPFFANRFPNDIVIADFNMDGNLDLGMANTEVSFLTVLLGNGKGQFQQAPNSPFTVNSKPHTHGIATGDFNGDGNLDLATDSWAENKVLIIFGDGKGNFGGQTSYKVGNRPYQRLRAADLNKDGNPDIVTSNLEGNNATVLLGTGEGKFQEAQGSPFPAGDAPFGLAIGDVNADNNQDIAIVNSPTITAESKGKDGLTILMGDGSGKFSALKGSPFETGKSPSRLAIGDLNADGINNIAVTNYNDKSISVFYMNKSGVAIQDLNGDGKNDIVVGNYDDNTLMILFQK